MISLSNTQFQRFVDFASAQPDAAKSKTVATIDAGPAEPGAEPLADRTITATAGDSVGKMFRRQSAIDANNRVRDLFKEAVADISDVENCVLCNAYIKCSSKKPVDTAMIENLVKHFEAHPEIAGQFAIGVRQGCEKKFLDAVKKNLTQNFKICMDKPSFEITGFTQEVL